MPLTTQGNSSAVENMPREAEKMFSAVRNMPRSMQSAARQKEAERLFALKRDIYLPAIESFVVANGYIGQLPTLPIARIQEGTPLMELARNTSRISLVAPKEVLTTTQTAVAHLLSAAMILSREPLGEGGP